MVLRLRLCPGRGLRLCVQPDQPGRGFDRGQRCRLFRWGGWGWGGCRGRVLIAVENQRRIYLDVNVVRLRRRQGLDFTSAGEYLRRSFSGVFPVRPLIV